MVKLLMLARCTNGSLATQLLQAPPWHLFSPPHKQHRDKVMAVMCR